MGPLSSEMGIRGESLSSESRVMVVGRVTEGRGRVRGTLVVKSNGGKSLRSEVEGGGPCISSTG